MTEIIVRGRQGGKTTELIRRSAGTGAYIVVTDRQRSGHVRRLARELGLVIPFPMTMDEWLRHEYHSAGVRGLLFDDLDDIVAAMSVVPVLAATWTDAEHAPPSAEPPSAPPARPRTRPLPVWL